MTVRAFKEAIDSLCDTIAATGKHTGKQVLMNLVVGDRGRPFSADHSKYFGSAPERVMSEKEYKRLRAALASQTFRQIPILSDSDLCKLDTVYAEYQRVAHLEVLPALSTCVDVIDELKDYDMEGPVPVGSALSTFVYGPLYAHDFDLCRKRADAVARVARSRHREKLASRRLIVEDQDLHALAARIRHYAYYRMGERYIQELELQRFETCAKDRWSTEAFVVRNNARCYVDPLSPDVFAAFEATQTLSEGTQFPFYSKSAGIAQNAAQTYIRIAKEQRSRFMDLPAEALQGRTPHDILSECADLDEDAEARTSAVLKCAHGYTWEGDLDAAQHWIDRAAADVSECHRPRPLAAMELRTAHIHHNLAHARRVEDINAFHEAYVSGIKLADEYATVGMAQNRERTMLLIKHELNSLRNRA